jgi:hypothetical protein
MINPANEKRKRERDIKREEEEERKKDEMESNTHGTKRTHHTDPTA